MKPADVAGVPPKTAWLTVGWWWYLLTCGLATSAAELVSIDVVNSARCHVRCLSLIQGYRESEANRVDLLTDCRQDSRCSDCTRPCDRHLSSSACHEYCVQRIRGSTRMRYINLLLLTYLLLLYLLTQHL